MSSSSGRFDFLGKDLASTLDAWHLIKGDTCEQPENSSSSREKRILRAMYIAHTVGRDDALSRDIISSLTPIRYRFKSAADTLKTVVNIFKTTSNGTANIDTVIGRYRSKVPNWPNLSKNSLTVDQISQNRVFLTALSSAYEKAVVLGQLPKLMDELTSYEEELRWLDHNTNYTVADYIDALSDDMVKEVIEQDLPSSPLRLSYKK